MSNNGGGGKIEFEYRIQALPKGEDLFKDVM